MERLSLILVAAGLGVLLLAVALGLLARRRGGARQEGPEAQVPDPLFAPPVDPTSEPSPERVAEELRGLGEALREPPLAAPVQQGLALEEPPGRPLEEAAQEEPGSAAAEAGRREGEGGIPAAPAGEPSRPRRAPPRLVEDDSQVVVLHVVARDGQRLRGGGLRRALEACGLEHGPLGIYHRYDPRRPEDPPRFSVANMVQPGRLDPEELERLVTPGLSLFMVPSGEAAADLAAFDEMVATARRLAEAVDGEVRDARRNPLTRQEIGHLREQIGEWCRRARLASPASPPG